MRNRLPLILLSIVVTTFNVAPAYAQLETFSKTINAVKNVGKENLCKGIVGEDVFKNTGKIAQNNRNENSHEYSSKKRMSRTNSRASKKAVGGRLLFIRGRGSSQNTSKKTNRTENLAKGKRSNSSNKDFMSEWDKTKVISKVVDYDCSNLYNVAGEVTKSAIEWGARDNIAATQAGAEVKKSEIAGHTEIEVTRLKQGTLNEMIQAKERVKKAGIEAKFQAELFNSLLSDW